MEPKSKNLISVLLVFAVYIAICYYTTRFNLLISRIDIPLGINVLIFSIACFGLVTIAVESAIADPVRKLLSKIPFIGHMIYEMDSEGFEIGGVLSCALCTGMWVGMILPILGLTLFPLHRGIDLFIHGTFGAGSTWLLHLAAEKLQKEPFPLMPTK